MTAPLVADQPFVPSHRLGPNTTDDSLADRVRHLEVDIGAVRRTVAELAEIVVGEIKDRRATAPGGDSRFGDGSALPVLETTVAARAKNRPWLLVDLLREIGVTVRMYFDPRYRVRRGTQLLVPSLLGMIGAAYVVFNYFFVFPVVSPVLERLTEVVIAMLLFKVISREIARYRQSVAEYAAAGRGAIAVATRLMHQDPDEAAAERQGGV